MDKIYEVNPLNLHEKRNENSPYTRLMSGKWKLVNTFSNMKVFS